MTQQITNKFNLLENIESLAKDQNAKCQQPMKMRIYGRAILLPELNPKMDRFVVIFSYIS